MTETQGAAGLEPPAFENTERLIARLDDYLSRIVGAVVTVERLTKFPAGFSWITYGVALSGFPAAREVILRIGPPYGLFAPYSAMPEFDSLERAGGEPRARTARLFRQRRSGHSRRAVLPLREGRRRHAVAVGRAGPDARRRAARAVSPPTSSTRSRRCTGSIGARRRSQDGAKASRSTTPRICRSMSGRPASARWALRPHPMAHRALALAARASRRGLSGCRSSTATIGSAISSNATVASPRFSIGSWCISATPSRTSAGRSCRNIAAADAAGLRPCRARTISRALRSAIRD